MRAIVGLGVAIGAAVALASCAPDHAKQTESGEQLYAGLCASCHGARGEGKQGPSLRDLDRKYDEGKLASYIDGRMPLEDPKKCGGACPSAVARYILATFRGEIACSAPPLQARAARLLNRREYKNTLEDLFGAGAMTAPCGTVTFSFDQGALSPKTVHVAGDFNGWAGTIAAGGWPMQKQASIWSLTRQVPLGSHTYKFVLDESQWITDPKNPKQASDGFGGQNSVLDVACAPNMGGAIDVAVQSLPPDTRPQGFLFDDAAQGRVVTGDLGDSFVRAALAIAQSVDTKPLMICDPSAADCAEKTASAMLLKIFRRPATPSEVARYAALVGKGDYAKGVRGALAAALASPGFLYRTEIGDRQQGGGYRLTPYEVASALSYGLWSTMPDAQLMDAARRGALVSAGDIEAQARRMLADPRARRTARAFAEEWLGAENVLTVVKSQSIYPDLDDAVRASMLEETRRLFESVMFDGSHKASELFTADYTFLDARLSKFYGIPGASGDFQRVKYPDGTRAGVLGHGSVLATTAHSDQGSPILRGLFVRRRLLCQEFPAPPPNAGGIPKIDPNATTRERFAQHTASDFCKSCHQYIDGVGFGFERFDGAGHARAMEAGKPIDTLGDMNDVEGLGKGTHAPFQTLAELGQTLASSDAAKACVAKQYWRFVRGGVEEDVCSVQSITQRFRATGGDLQDLVVAIVTSPDFVVRK